MSSHWPNETIHRLFEAQAARSPEAVALVWEGQTLSYGALNAGANRLARHLRTRGVGRDTLVGVCLDSSPRMLIALLGILKAGGAYLPLDPDYPPERLSFMLADAQVPLLLTQSRLCGRLPSRSFEVLCLDTEEARYAEGGEENPSGGAGSSDLAYVIYTSGSSGKPKGVMIEHRSVVANLRWRQETFTLTPRDRMLQTYSFSFDPSVWAFFWPLAAGAALVLPRAGGIADSGYLVETMAAQHISVMGVGPAMWNVLLAEQGIAECQHLRHAFCGGETLTADLRRRFLAQFPSASLHNVYGPTEATIDATWWTCPRPDTGETATPVGRPLPHMVTEILHEDGRRVAAGDVGELYLGGVGLARGYWNRPELTRERFIANPFSQDADARLYRTGDLARQRDDGALEYWGRRDDQVKVRGYRIELGEIESALAAQPGVRAAAVTAQEDGFGDKRLTACVVPDAPRFPLESQERQRLFHGWRGALQETLPAYMVPSAWALLEALPLTPSGKVDRRALPEVATTAWNTDANFAPPQSSLHRQLALVWEGLLDARPIGIHDDFFDLGGHSLLAARLMDQVARVCGRRLPMSALYEGATIAQLAETLSNIDVEDAPEPISVLQSQGHRPPFFFLYGFLPLGGFYCVPLARRLGSAQPFHALHPQRSDGGGPPRSLERMAAYHIGVMRRVQPHGPYSLGGYCGSGLVAYEMARQLAKQGETVSHLILIEVAPINARLRLALRRLTEKVVGNNLVRRQQVFQWLQRIVLPRASIGQAWKRRRKRHADADPLVERSNILTAAYVPGPYHGAVTLIQAGDETEEFPVDPVTLWRELLPNVKTYSVAGTHLSCLTEHLDSLADRLKRCLSENDHAGS